MLLKPLDMNKIQEMYSATFDKKKSREVVDHVFKKSNSYDKSDSQCDFDLLNHNCNEIILVESDKSLLKE